MRRIREVCFLFALTSCAGFALDNSVTIREISGTAQANFPVSLMAAIARSEIPDYARPALTVYNKDGSVYWARAAMDYWQSDVKTRWRDAVANRTITAISNPVTNVCPSSPTVACTDTPYVFVTSAGHGFRDGERVRIQSSSTPELNGAWTVVDRTDDTFALAGLASVSNPGSTNATATGPTEGSWATGVVTLFIPNLPAGGSARIDFINDAKPSHTSSNTGLTKSQLLDRRWDAVMEVSSPVKDGSKGTFVVDARTIVEKAPESDCGLKKWLGGPLVTEYIVEDNCSAASPPYDFGWTPVGPPTGFVMASALPAAQSDGTQTFELSDASDIDASRPVLMHYTTGAPSLGGSFDVEYFSVCGKSGNTLTVCKGGRGLYGSDHAKSRTDPRLIPAGAIVGVIQGKDADDVHRNLHPSFIVRTYTNTNESPYGGVRVRFLLNNNNFHKPGTSYIAVTMKTSQGAVRWKSGVGVGDYTRAEPEPYFSQTGSRDSKLFWDGDDPEFYCDNGSGPDPCVRGERARRWLLDPNLKYKIYAGFVLPFDQSEPNKDGPSFNVDYKKYLSSDRGETGTMMSKQGNYGWDSDPSPAVNKHYQWTIRAQGLSTYSKDSDDTADYAGVVNDNDREEGWVWSRVLARTLPVLGTDPRAWEMLFGTSVPGGAGMQAVEHHLPINWMEGDVTRGGRRYSFSTCATCTAFGRPISIDARPSVYLHNLDYTGAPDRINSNAWTNSKNLWYARQAPGMALVGYTTLDHGHRMPYAPYLYLVTGDYFDLLQVQSWATFLVAIANYNRSTSPAAPTRNSDEFRHGNWGVMVYGTSHPRVMAWPMLSVTWAAALSPNVPQFGSSYAPPERYLFENKLVKTFQAWEGMVGMTDGSFPPRDASCSGITWSASTAGVTTERTNDVWCWSRQQNGRNVPMPLSIVTRPQAMGGNIQPYGEVSKTGGTIAPYTMYQMTVTLWHAKRLGNSFIEPMFYRNAIWLTNFIVNSQTSNPFRAFYYLVPWLSGSSEYTYQGLDGPETVTPNQFYPSWGAWVDALNDNAQNPTTWNTRDSTIPEYGYPHYARAALSSIAGLGIVDTTTPGCRPAEKPAGCSADEAYATVKNLLPNLRDYVDQKRLAQLPEDKITGFAIENGSSNRPSISFAAPNGNGCTYSIGTSAPSTSLDEGERKDNPNGGRHSISLDTGALGEVSYLRITCGAARTTIQMTTGLRGGVRILRDVRQSPASGGAPRR